MRRISPRQARRLMSQLGMNVEELSGVTQVIIRTPEKETVIDNPNVSVTHMQGQVIYQVMDGVVTEREFGEREEAPPIPEEDAQLVAQQANVPLEEAREALEEAEGNLAQAILNLTQKR